MKISPMLWISLMVFGAAGFAGIGFSELLEWTFTTFGAGAQKAFMVGFISAVFIVGLVGFLIQRVRR